MQKYKFVATAIIEADSEQEAKDKFSENSFDFASTARIDEVMDEIYECEKCGSERIWLNSPGELQCDDCGHSETN